MKNLYVLLIFEVFLKCKGISFPSTQFIMDFVLKHDRRNLIVHTSSESQHSVKLWKQSLEYSQRYLKLDHAYYLLNLYPILKYIFSSDYLIQTMVRNIDQYNFQENLETNEFDLHVFFQSNANETMNLMKLFDRRNDLDIEYWLVDISSWTNEKEFVNEVNDMKLDLDDNVFLFQSNETSEAINIWELYQIHGSIPKTILKYGYWTPESGLNVDTSSKWRRRKDLQVLDKNAFHGSIGKIIYNFLGG